MNKKIIGILMALLLPSMSQATTSPEINGNTLYHGYQLFERGFEYLNNSDYSIALMYMAYVAGSGSTLSNIGLVCGPSITIGQEADIVGIYLRDNPAKRTQFPPSILVAQALIKALPCQKAKK